MENHVKSLAEVQKDHSSWFPLKYDTHETAHRTVLERNADSAAARQRFKGWA